MTILPVDAHAKPAEVVGRHADAQPHPGLRLAVQLVPDGRASRCTTRASPTRVEPKPACRSSTTTRHVLVRQQPVRQRARCLTPTPGSPSSSEPLSGSTMTRPGRPVAPRDVTAVSVIAVTLRVDADVRPSPAGWRRPNVARGCDHGGRRFQQAAERHGGRGARAAAPCRRRRTRVRVLVHALNRQRALTRLSNLGFRGACLHRQRRAAHPGRDHRRAAPPGRPDLARPPRQDIRSPGTRSRR